MSPLIHLPDSVREEAGRRLDAITRETGARILLAIESGSRAWGFPSPDSDYDVRFLYVRPVRDYVALKPVRDVIETPIEGLWDVNGWDLRKALVLLRKGNAVIVEWLRSPLIYRQDEAFADKLRALADDFADADAAVRHYHGLLCSQYRGDFEGRARVKLKKYFYSVRAAAALEWVKVHATAPPMSLPDLLAGGVVTAQARALLDPMLTAKATSKEMGEAPRIPELDAYIEAMQAWAEGTGLLKRETASPSLIAATDALILEALGLS